MKSSIANILFLGFALGTVGCSPTKDVVTKQLEDVKREMTSLRATQAALTDRLDLLETSPKPVAVATDTESPVSSDRPSLEVVHLSPDEEPSEPPAVVAPPIDDSPPMVIVGDEQGVEQVDTEAAATPQSKKAKAPFRTARYPRKRGQ